MFSVVISIKNTRTYHIKKKLPILVLLVALGLLFAVLL